MQPRHYSSIEKTSSEGFPWAADNDCFQGLKPVPYMKMLDRISGLDGCLFVTVPDVVADSAKTIDLWDEWLPELTDRNLPPAFVLQDGITSDDVPWSDCSAVFVGGSTGFKLGETARDLVREANARGVWTHMGRVNTMRRIRYAKSIGCKSIDGSKWARWKILTLKEGLRGVSVGPQLNLWENA